MTEDKWCEANFMFHGWKLNKIGENGWKSPFSVNCFLTFLFETLTYIGTVSLLTTVFPLINPQSLVNRQSVIGEDVM